jgi:hypothetical protein
MAVIYLLRCIKNNKCFIGYNSNEQDELQKSLTRGTYANEKLQQDWNLYGEKNFKYEVLEQVWNSKRVSRKNYYINEFMSTDPLRGYNIGRNQKKESK